MNNMFTVDMETAKRIERIRKILAPVLIAALIISGLFVPKMKVKAAGEKTLVIRIVNEGGEVISQGYSLPSTSEGAGWVFFTFDRDELMPEIPVSDGKIATSLGYYSNNADVSYDRLFRNGEGSSISLIPNDNLSTETSIAVSGDIFTENTGTVGTLNYTIEYNDVTSSLGVSAPEADDSNDYVITPIPVSSVTKVSGGYYVANFEGVTLSDDIEPYEQNLGITYFDGKWEYINDDYSFVLENGVSKSVSLPLDFLISEDTGKYGNVDVEINPVYSKINLPIVFNSGDNGQFSNDADTYTTTVSSTDIVEYNQTEYFSVPITMPSLASVANNYLFMNWKLSAADMESRIEIVKDGNSYNAVSAGDTVNVYFPVSLASQANANGLDATFNANVVSVRGEFSFATSSNAGSIAEIDAVKTVYASSYDNENGAFTFTIPMPTVQLESGATNEGFLLNADDNASTYYPYEIDGQTPLNVESPITDSNFSLVVFSQRVSNTDDASVKKVVLGFTALIDSLSNYSLTVVARNPMSNTNSNDSGETLIPVERLSNGGLKYRYTLPATSGQPEIGYGWKIGDTINIFTRSNGNEISYDDGMLAGETVYITIRNYEQGMTEEVILTDGFIINPGTYSVNPGGNYFLTNGNWTVGDDGYKYNVSGVASFSVSYEGPLTFTK